MITMSETTMILSDTIITWPIKRKRCREYKSGPKSTLPILPRVLSPKVRLLPFSERKEIISSIFGVDIKYVVGLKKSYLSSCIYKNR